MPTPKGLGQIPVPESAGKAAGEAAGLDRRQLTAVGKALRLLAAFRHAGPSVSLGVLAARAHMPKSTTFRLLTDLEGAGFVERAGADYRLGLSLFELGSRVDFNRPQGLREVAMHDMCHLYVQAGLPVHLAVLSGSQIVYVETLHKPESRRVLDVPGARAAASPTALGKAILAFRAPQDIRVVAEGGLVRETPHSITSPSRFIDELKQVRSSGIAFEREERALGLAAVAAPIVFDGQAIASVAVSGPTGSVNWTALGAKVKATAASITTSYERAMHNLH